MGLPRASGDRPYTEHDSGAPAVVAPRERG